MKKREESGMAFFMIQSEYHTEENEEVMYDTLSQGNPSIEDTMAALACPLTVVQEEERVWQEKAVDIWTVEGMKGFQNAQQRMQKGQKLFKKAPLVRHPRMPCNE